MSNADLETIIRLEDAVRVQSLKPHLKETLVLAGKGLSDADLGRLIGVHKTTISDRMKAIFKALDVHTRVEAAVTAVKAGLL